MVVMRESWTDERLDEFGRRIDERFDRVDERFDEVDRRFEEVDRRFDRLEGRLDWFQKVFIQSMIAFSATMVTGFVALFTLIAWKL